MEEDSRTHPYLETSPERTEPTNSLFQITTHRKQQVEERKARCRLFEERKTNCLGYPPYIDGLVKHCGSCHSSVVEEAQYACIATTEDDYKLFTWRLHYKDQELARSLNFPEWMPVNAVIMKGVYNTLPAAISNVSMQNCDTLKTLSLLHRSPKLQQDLQLKRNVPEDIFRCSYGCCVFAKLELKLCGKDPTSEHIQLSGLRQYKMQNHDLPKSLQTNAPWRQVRWKSNKKTSKIK